MKNDVYFTRPEFNPLIRSRATHSVQNLIPASPIA